MDTKLLPGRMTLEEWQKTKRYVIVTAISTHRMRYCIPVDELQKLNPSVPIEGQELQWAEDTVTCEEAGEFSQKHLGEQIVDSILVSEKEMLRQFDQDNDCLRNWSTEKKIEWVRNWRVDK